MGDSTTDSIIENYINGNLTFAKNKAKRVNLHRLFTALKEHGKGTEAAMAIAAFLKGHGSFQAACDADHAEQDARKENR